jgi:hypothetical protein
MVKVPFNLTQQLFQMVSQLLLIMFIQENSSLVFIQVHKSSHSIYFPLHIYILDRGNMTCQRRPGSLGYETKDANTYAAWGVDYLKLDSCYTNGTPSVVEYSIMRDALNASGRAIFYSLCGMYTNC